MQIELLGGPQDGLETDVDSAAWYILLVESDVSEWLNMADPAIIAEVRVTDWASVYRPSNFRKGATQVWEFLPVTERQAFFRSLEGEEG